MTKGARLHHELNVLISSTLKHFTKSCRRNLANHISQTEEKNNTKTNPSEYDVEILTKLRKHDFPIYIKARPVKSRPSEKEVGEVAAVRHG